MLHLAGISLARLDKIVRKDLKFPANTCRNPEPLVQFQPKVLVDQKNKKAFATGGDVLLANGEKIPLPGGFALPTTGLWSGLLDIPQVGFSCLCDTFDKDLRPSGHASNCEPALVEEADLFRLEVVNAITRMCCRPTQPA